MQDIFNEISPKLHKLFLQSLGAVSIRKTVLPGMAIPMLKIRRPNGRLIFNMGIPIPGKDGLYIETGPWLLLAGLGSTPNIHLIMFLVWSVLYWYVFHCLFVFSWFRKDENATPPHYVLQPISVIYPEFNSPDPSVNREASNKWWSVFELLQQLLKDGAKKNLKDEATILKYAMSGMHALYSVAWVIICLVDV